MAETIREVLTPSPTMLDANENLIEAARAMREGDVGDVLVSRDGQFCGILTDRDLVVRGLATGSDPTSVRIGDICSKDVTFVAPTDTVDDALRLMREKALRRLPVLDRRMVVGIVTIGDLAIERDEGSALAQISAAAANV